MFNVQCLSRSCLVVLIGLLWLLTGCKNDKVAVVQVNTDTDTATVADTLVNPTEEELEQPMPVSAEKLFDDFIFNFVSSKRLQMERIAFPLKVNSGYKVEEIQKEDWQMERFFMSEGVYTLLLDSEEDMEKVKDTSIDEAIVEKIFLEREFVKQYLFSRKDGRWMLCEVRNQTLPNNPNASFISFYHRFVSDSAFQVASLNDEIEFAGPDPDDDFEDMEGFITPNLWEDFAPDMPQGILYNIVYGRENSDSTHKVLVVRGIANGMEEGLTFAKKGGEWKLTKLVK